MRLVTRGIRQRGDFVGPIGCSPPPPAWPDATTSPRRVAGAPPRAAEHFARLARKHMPIKHASRWRALSGRFSPRRLELASVSDAD